MAVNRQLDVLVVGLARSGTTMLTNLLTNPAAGRLCLAEPRLTTWRGYKENKKKYFRHLGATDPINPRTMTDFLFQHDKTGVKEVRRRHIRAALVRFQPRHILLAVRDARSSLVSYYERHMRRGEKQWGRPKPFPARLFLRTAPVMLELMQQYPERVYVLPYEDFVQHPTCRDQLAARLNWPLDGSLATFDAMNRGDESGKHDHQISTRSLKRATPQDPKILAALNPVLARLADYQKTFGYPLAWDDPQPSDAVQP